MLENRHIPMVVMDWGEAKADLPTLIDMAPPCGRLYGGSLSG